jgi:DNA-directed RNA polymerase subunit RPC12/RpoP
MFIGRNGPDHLSFALTIAAFVLSFIPWAYMPVISLALIAVALLRMFSKNIEKRRKENLVLLGMVNKVKTWYYRSKVKREQRKIYKVFKCPQCFQKLRVPRGKGKVQIKCSKCGHKMTRTT